MSTVKGVVFAGELSDDEDLYGSSSSELVKQAQDAALSENTRRNDLLLSSANNDVVKAFTSSSVEGSSSSEGVPQQQQQQQPHEAIPKLVLHRLAESAHSELSAAIRSLKEKVLPSRALSGLHSLEQLSKLSANNADDTVQMFTALTNQLAALDNALGTIQATASPDGKTSGAQYRLPAISIPAKYDLAAV